jgi:hypothetical protein
MIKSDDGKTEFYGSRNDIRADFGCIYNVMLKFFDRKEIEEIEEHTRKFIKKRNGGLKNGKYNL